MATGVCVCVSSIIVSSLSAHAETLPYEERKVYAEKVHMYCDTFCKHTMGLNTLQCSTVWQRIVYIKSKKHCLAWKAV